MANGRWQAQEATKKEVCMRQIDTETDKPFIASFLVVDRYGGRLFPAGVVLARDEFEAREMATTRWPGYVLPTPAPWGKVSAQDRLLALMADRGDPILWDA